MFQSWWASSATKKKTEDIPAKIESFNQKLTLENMAFVQKKASLQMIVGEKGKGALKQPTATRLIAAMRRHQAMMKVYHTSLTALESTQTNIELQQVTTEVQRLIGRAGRPDFDGVEDSLETMADINMERQQLAHLMMTENDEDDDSFIDDLNLAFPDDEVKTTPTPKPPAPNPEELPCPPTYIAQEVGEAAAGPAAAIQKQQPLQLF